MQVPCDLSDHPEASVNFLGYPSEQAGHVQLPWARCWHQSVVPVVNYVHWDAVVVEL